MNAFKTLRTARLGAGVLEILIKIRLQLRQLTFSKQKRDKKKRETRTSRNSGRKGRTKFKTRPVKREALDLLIIFFKVKD